MTTLDDVYSMISQGWNTPDGRGRIAIAEESMRHAEALGEPDAEFAARMLATTAYHQGGEPAKAFVTFARCLAQYDADPGSRNEHDEHLLLWHFKFVTGALPRFPEIPLQRTYEVLDDMERRYRAGGYSLHAVYAYRQRVARHLGDEVLSDHYYRLWDTAPRDNNSDCIGCDPTSKVYFLASRERFEEAVALAEPVLAGRLTCAEQPQEILTSLLVPYLRTGQLDRARDAHRRAYRALSGSAANLGSIATHLEFCLLTGNEVRGLELIERHLAWLDRAPTPIAAMDFAAAAAAVLRRLDDMECRTPQGPRSTHELATELAERATEIAARFDARNGNGHQGAEVARALALEPIVGYLPLSITARAARPASTTHTSESEAVVDLGAVPAETPVDEQLAQAERWRVEGEEPRAFALWSRIEQQFPAESLAPGQRARLEQASAYRTTEVDETTVAHFDAAAVLYAEAGETVREFGARGQAALARLRIGDEPDQLVIIRQTTDFVLRNGTVEDRAGGLVRLAFALAVSGEHAEAVEVLEQLEADGAELPRRRLVRERLMRAQLLAGMDRPEESLALLNDVIEILAGDGRSDELATARITRARLLGQRGEHLAAVADFEGAAVAAADRGLARSARLDAAFMLVGTDRAGEFIDDIVEHVCAMVEVGADKAAAYSRHRLAVALNSVGRHRESAEVGEEALAYFASQSDEQAMADECRGLLGTVYLSLGEPHAALAQFEELAANLNGYDNLAARAEVLERTAEILYRMDRDGAAADRYAESARVYREVGAELAAARTTRRRVTALHYAGQPDDARTVLAELDGMLATIQVAPDDAAQLTWELAMTGFDAAFVLANMGDHVGAAARVAPSAGLFRSIEAFEEALLAELRHGEILVAAGAADRGAEILVGVLEALPKDHRGRQETAWWLARAWDEMGEKRKAHKLRKEYDLEEVE